MSPTPVTHEHGHAGPLAAGQGQIADRCGRRLVDGRFPRSRCRAAWAALITLVASAGADSRQTYVNGNIYTMDPRQPRAECMVVDGERLTFVGGNVEGARLSGASPRIDLGGATVLPGLIDAHGHMANLGSFALGRLDLSVAKSFDDVIAIVVERLKSARPGEWILGGRWDHESWPGRTLPSHEALSAVSPDNPIWLARVDGHAGLANAAAMKLAGVSRETAPPAGGDIIKSAAGAPTGLFVDAAMALVAAKIDTKIADSRDLLLKAQEMCLAAGLTGVHDAGVAPADLASYRALESAGKLKIRVYAMVQGASAIAYFQANEPASGPRLSVRACKLVIDGAMGSRGAWLLGPYADRPRDDHGAPYSGLCVTPPEVVLRIASDALQRGYQVCAHAIGDRANRETLDAFAAALQQQSVRDHRFRIEHAQLLSPDDIRRFAGLGVIASMQPTHCISDMRWVEDRVGTERAAGAYAWATLLRSGARIAGGSDFPVESHNPFLGFHAAITRQDASAQPPGGWRPQERMTREEALRSMTLDAAHAAFDERERGSLEPGKLADFVVIDRDVMTCVPREILATQVRMTVIGGEPVYRQ